MSPKIQFFAGLIVGLSLALSLHVYSNVENFYEVHLSGIFSNFMKNKRLISAKDFDRSNETTCRNASELSLKGDDSIAQELYNKVRVACWILTSPSNLDTKAIYVKNTWSKKCHLVLFMSSVKNDTFPTVGLKTLEGRKHLTAKTMQAFQYLYDHHYNDADWFMKADDDTYVIMENLRYFLSEEDPSQPVYFGQKLTAFIKMGYASGGAGYVISKESLRRFGQRGQKFKDTCKADDGYEDVEISRCLESLGVRLEPSFDSLRRHRFHFTSPEEYLRATFATGLGPNEDSDLRRMGIGNMSNYAISFHYVSGRKMYDLEFYIYHLRPYGILNVPLALNARRGGSQDKNMTEMHKLSSWSN
ncbi:glycoprotein-N-acetylgalactosamine 3-beta-galactosyltransferase 1-like [Biomphalaria glabrata]|uniref:Glycoprotein-N-acetylgalactosamine 3-beta-galactosyltransferase 1 n=1 Tax=Biomphalaria glabrata TaxID=6526 RepID=A0A9W2ZF05_BIOGL|nr:glycoprotein-N-acetylgalactosamine 3-beta-galactosyltransferase 1-like [Biomphalaria glabrata]XP_055873480.1 glycoprotein-N-acetylgalactosamine 3-beta-galactosyltransferase 1-like [Biomphalaria glabrata]XP_055873481.1 glycoprotein-N-acetylgalactosamine 3-beta-galactosyltransferase 1-like [Biomphalaria glabrata]